MTKCKQFILKFLSFLTQNPSTNGDQSESGTNSPIKPKLTVCNSCVVTEDKNQFATRLVPLTDKEIEVSSISPHQGWVLHMILLTLLTSPLTVAHTMTYTGNYIFISHSHTISSGFVNIISESPDSSLFCQHTVFLLRKYFII